MSRRVSHPHIGVYRVIYQIQDKQLIVQVVRIGHRRDVYRGM